jgi:hypothetical protein
MVKIGDEGKMLPGSYSLTRIDFIFPISQNE